MLILAACMFVSVASFASALEVDPGGYILYCPCMGRFGNQMEQFLGALAFSKSVDRTLVVAPFVEYHRAHPNAQTVPFSEYLNLSSLKAYHRVLAMDEFMSELAPTLWPVGQRTVLCHGPRKPLKGTANNECNAKDGNPFGPFWDASNIDFEASEFYAPLKFEASQAAKWIDKYPSDKWPVLAFTGTPGSFPIRKDDVYLHQYLEWSDSIVSQAELIIDQHLQRPYIGAHLRIGSDWERACAHSHADRHLFASPQCLGYRFEHGLLTKSLCFPSDEDIQSAILKAARASSAKHVYIATDTPQSSRLSVIESALQNHMITMVTLPNSSPHVDLAILELSDHYIGNCVSTFSAIPSRKRRAKGNNNDSFWATAPAPKDEL